MAYTRQASVMWSGVMIHVIHAILRRPTGRYAYNPNAELIYFHFICWVLPLPMVLAPIFTGTGIYFEFAVLLIILFQMTTAVSATIKRGAGSPVAAPVARHSAGCTMLPTGPYVSMSLLCQRPFG